MLVNPGKGQKSLQRAGHVIGDRDLIAIRLVADHRQIAVIRPPAADRCAIARQPHHYRLLDSWRKAAAPAPPASATLRWERDGEPRLRGLRAGFGKILRSR